MKNKIKYGDIYIHKGKQYVFLNRGKMKHPDTGEWLDAVTYYDASNFYTCTLTRWETEFTQI